MKRWMKVLFLLVMTMTLGLSAAASAGAATVKRPNKVVNVTAKSGESKITLTWNKVAGADGYNVYRVSNSGKMKRIARTNSNRCIVKKLTNGKQYAFCIKAYKESGTKLVESKKSAVVKETPHIIICGSPELELSNYTGQKAYLTWDPVPYANEYIIYQKKEKTDNYKIVGTTKKTKTVIKKLKDQSFYFCIKARRVVGRKKVCGYASNEIFVKSYKTIHTMYYYARTTRDLNAPLAVKTGEADGQTHVLESYSQTGGSCYIPAGCEVTVVKRSGGDNVVMLDDGRLAFVNYSNLNYKKSIYTDETYPKQTAEMIVNMRAYSSPTPYLIWISLSNQSAYFFHGSARQWELIDSSRCTTGMVDKYSYARFDSIAYKRPGPKGVAEFELGGYAPYACDLASGSGAIHGWLYYDIYCTQPAPGQLGTPVSNGCLRVEDRIMHDIWANEGKFSEGTLGTTVVVY